MEKRNVSGHIREMMGNVEETRTIRFVASTSGKDRHRTVLNQERWNLENFNRNGIVGYQHNVYGGGMCSGPNPDDVIGKAKAWVENGELITDITFEPAEINPTAEKVFRKVLFGSLNAVSVGFLEEGNGRYGEGEERQGGKDETYYFEGQELLEISVVNIPSNPEALKNEFRSSTYDAIHWLKRNVFSSEVSYSDIEKMTVGDILRAVNRHAGSEEKHEAQKEQQPAFVDASIQLKQAEKKQIINQIFLKNETKR